MVRGPSAPAPQSAALRCVREARSAGHGADEARYAAGARADAPPPQQPSTPLTPSTRLAARASETFSKSLNSFTSSPRFLKLCSDAFESCDLDKSGTIDSGELFAAILLLNHHLNSLPLGKKQLPPSRDKVNRLIKQFGHGRSSLTKQDFVAVCQELCSELATGVPRNMFIVFIMCPIMASRCKSFLLGTVGGLHPHIGVLRSGLTRQVAVSDAHRPPPQPLP